MLLDNVLVYAILGSFAFIWVFDFWNAGRSDED